MPPKGRDDLSIIYTDPNASSSSLSDVDLGEHIHQLSSPTSPVSCKIPTGAERPLPKSPLNTHYEKQGPDQYQKPPRLVAKHIRAYPPPLRTSSRPRPLFSMDTDFGQPSVVSSPVKSVQPPFPAAKQIVKGAPKQVSVSSPRKGLNQSPRPMTALASASPRASARPLSIAERAQLTAQPSTIRFSEPNGFNVEKGQTYPPIHQETEEYNRSAAPSPSIGQNSPTRRPPGYVKPYRYPPPEPEQPNLDITELSSLIRQALTVSYLVFFSILGTLARIGLKHLTFYPGAPINLPVIWANFSGTLIMGYLTESTYLFNTNISIFSSKLSKSSHTRSTSPKSIPLYIGLTTGFCGSLTSFSSIMLDTFLSISNNLPSPINHPSSTTLTTSSTTHRQAGYSILAVLATIILHICIPLSALFLGSHLSLLLYSILPRLSLHSVRKILDRLIIPLAALTYLAVILLTIIPPDRPGGSLARPSWSNETWRGWALFALVLAPLGCLLRYGLSLALNPISASFPLGTFAANIFATAVLAMAYDLQHVPLGLPTAAVGGGRVACQILQGVVDGLCGACSTVSTWCAELVTLAKQPGAGAVKRAYVYGASTMLVGLAVVVIVLGSVRWSIGWGNAVC